MTALYALNAQQEQELFDEVLHAVREKKVRIIEHWLDEDCMVVGASEAGISAAIIHNTYPDIAQAIKAKIGKSTRSTLEMERNKQKRLLQQLRLLRQRVNSAERDVTRIASENAQLVTENSLLESRLNARNVVGLRKPLQVAVPSERARCALRILVIAVRQDRWCRHHRQPFIGDAVEQNRLGFSNRILLEPRIQAAGELLACLVAKRGGLGFSDTPISGGTAVNSDSGRSSSDETTPTKPFSGLQGAGSPGGLERRQDAG
jgi:hypothetical protein